MPRPAIKKRTPSQVGAALQEKLDAEDALRSHKVPRGMMGSAWGFNRPKGKSPLQRIVGAFKGAVESAKQRRNPQPQIEGAMDVSDIDPRQKRSRTHA